MEVKVHPLLPGHRRPMDVKGLIYATQIVGNTTKALKLLYFDSKYDGGWTRGGTMFNFSVIDIFFIR